RSRSNLGWVIPVATPLKNGAGEIRAVLAAATSLDGFRAMVDIDGLPPGSVVRIVDGDGNEVTTVASDPAAGAELLRLGNPARQFRLEHGSEVVTLPGSVTRVVGFATTRRASWLITVGLPVAAAVRVANGR